MGHDNRADKVDYFIEKKRWDMITELIRLITLLDHKPYAHLPT